MWAQGSGRFVGRTGGGLRLERGGRAPAPSTPEAGAAAADWTSVLGPIFFRYDGRDASAGFGSRPRAGLRGWIWSKTRRIAGGHRIRVFIVNWSITIYTAGTGRDEPDAGGIGLLAFEAELD